MWLPCPYVRSITITIKPRAQGYIFSSLMSQVTRFIEEKLQNGQLFVMPECQWLILTRHVAFVIANSVNSSIAS